MKTLLAGALKIVIQWVASAIMSWWNRYQEQKKRHAENKEKTDAYKEASDEKAKDEFSRLP